jgi:hypothetical protein
VPTKLQERIGALEGRLRQLQVRQQRIDARKSALASRRARADDIRRKILLGGLVLAKLEAGALDQGTFKRWLDEALTREADRALFGLRTK